MISVANGYRIYIAAEPVDFRKGMNGLAAYVKNTFDLDPFTGALFVFRSKGGNSIKVLLWDGTGLVLVSKRLDTTRFVWPKLKDGTITITKTQFDALFEGLDWRRIVPARTRKPILA